MSVKVYDKEYYSSCRLLFLHTVVSSSNGSLTFGFRNELCVEFKEYKLRIKHEG